MEFRMFSRLLLAGVMFLQTCPGALALDRDDAAQLESLIEAIKLIEQHYYEPKTRCELVASTEGALEEAYGLDRSPQVQSQQATIFQGDYPDRFGIVCLQVLVDTMNEIRRSGRQKDLAPICEKAIEGMVAALDGRSLFLNSEVPGEAPSGDDPARETDSRATFEAVMFEPGYVYVKIPTLREDLLTVFAGEMARLGAGTSLKGLVVDLRDNGDGPLDPAVRFADLFLEDGLIVTARGRDDQASFSVQADRPMGFKGIPLVLLVNEGTGSGAEIIASALQQHKRALLVGGRTGGRGAIATLFPLKNGHALKLTTAALFTADGTPVEDNPLVPDLAVDSARGEEAIPLAFRLIRTAASPAFEDLLAQARLLGGEKAP